MVNTIIIPVILVLLSVGLAMFINIKIKFAKTEQEAISHAKKLFLNVGLALINCIIVYFLFLEFTSTLPLDRKSLFLILVYSFCLFHTLMVYYLEWIRGILKDMANLFKLQNQAIDEHDKKIKTLHNKSIETDAD